MRMLPNLISDEVRSSIERSANPMVGTMQRLAPDDPMTGGDDLRASIRWHWAEAGTVGRANWIMRALIRAGGTPGTAREVRKGSGVLTDTARLQEFGTRKMPANPFFFPVWRANRRLVRNRIRAAVRRAVKRANQM